MSAQQIESCSAPATVRDRSRARSIAPASRAARRASIHPQHQVRLGRPLPRAAHALLLDRIVAVADAGGVEQRHRIAVEIEMHLDHVARRAGDRRHDRRLAPGDPVEQGRLAGVRRPRNRHHQPVAQPLAARGARQRLARFRRAARARSFSAGATRSSGTSASSEKSIRASTSASASISRARQVSARSPSKPLQLPIGLPALRFGLGADQIGQALDRGEIELAVLEGAARELAGLRRPQALDRARAPPAPRR